MFKRLIGIITLACFCLVVVGCGSDRRVCFKADDGINKDCQTYGQYGLFNESDMRNPKVQYKVIVGNIVWSIVLVETIVVPLVVVGWFLFEPVGPKNPKNPPGVI